MNVRQKTIKLIYKLLLLILLGLGGMGSALYANTLPTQNFGSWKIQQQKHDLRLQAEKRSSTSDNNQYIPQFAVKSSLAENNLPKQQVLGTGLRVNINTANAQELTAKLDSIGAKKAQAIIAYRNKNGKFNRIEELKNVKGIGEKIFERNRNRIKLVD